MPDARQTALEADLRSALAEADPTLLRGIARALERDGDRLVGGAWGTDDGDGCLLTLAARELGADTGEELLRTSVAAVRIPALFDELWAEILRRSGDAELARRITHRLVAEALALGGSSGAGVSGPGARLERAPEVAVQVPLQDQHPPDADDDVDVVHPGEPLA